MLVNNRLSAACYRTQTLASMMAKSLDKTHLSVTAKGFPIVRDPATLHNADTLKEYESRKAEEIFHFRVQAQ